MPGVDPLPEAIFVHLFTVAMPAKVECQDRVALLIESFGEFDPRPLGAIALQLVQHQDRGLIFILPGVEGSLEFDSVLGFKFGPNAFDVFQFLGASRSVGRDDREQSHAEHKAERSTNH